MVPPICRCDQTQLSELGTEELRETWSEWEGIKWSAYSEGHRCWHLCLEYHRAAWGDDGRGRRHSVPKSTLPLTSSAAEANRSNSFSLAFMPESLKHTFCEDSRPQLDPN